MVRHPSGDRGLYQEMQQHVRWLRRLQRVLATSQPPRAVAIQSKPVGTVPSDDIDTSGSIGVTGVELIIGP
jgi:hypothetical protein